MCAVGLSRYWLVLPVAVRALIGRVCPRVCVCARVSKQTLPCRLGLGLTVCRCRSCRLFLASLQLAEFGLKLVTDADRNWGVLSAVRPVRAASITVFTVDRSWRQQNQYVELLCQRAALPLTPGYSRQLFHSCVWVGLATCSWWPRVSSCVRACVRARVCVCVCVYTTRTNTTTSTSSTTITSGWVWADPPVCCASYNQSESPAR